MELFKKIGIALLVILIIAYASPAIIGSFLYLGYGEELFLAGENDNGRLRIVALNNDHTLEIAEETSQDGVFAYQKYSYSAQKIFHIGPLFDNTKGRFPFICTAIRPNAKNVSSIYFDKLQVSAFDGVRSTDKGFVDLSNRKSTLIIRKDGSVHFMDIEMVQKDEGLIRPILSMFEPIND